MSLEALSSNARKKVFVSGCFDLFHSGHVEFFLEAAKLGDLFVRLGTCENIKRLKNHNTMYSDEERLFMVQNISCVHDAKLSKGTGVYDFFEDMREIKPDIYFVNEDASALDGRIQFCKEMGIEIIINKRNPKTGLTERSSTSIKKRMREMIIEEECQKDLNNMPYYDTSFPWRLCFAGGWMDLKWCNELYPGSVITINIKFNPQICKDMCGLATSSRKVAVKLWNGSFPSHLQAGEAAKYLYGAENFKHFGKATGTMPDWETVSYSAGSQDHLGIMFPGINKFNYSGQHWPTSMINFSDRTDDRQKAIFSWLESVLWVVEIPFVSRPDGYNSQKLNNLTDESISLVERVNMVKALANASELVWQGICSCDSDMVGAGLSENMKAWERMLPYTVDPYQYSTKFDSSISAEELQSNETKSKALREFVKRYDRPYSKGCLFSGAGGGYLFVISDTTVENGIKINVNCSHFCKPFTSDNLDSRPHPVFYS